MKKMEFLVLALSMMVAMVAPALAAQNPEASQGSYDIAVYISGTDILAEDSNGQVISSGVAGTDDSRVIQTAVNAISDGTILLQAGTYTLSDSADVRVSNPEMGSLTVISTPSEARIYLDGADTGKATPYTFTGISPGVHNVSVELSGYTTPEPQTATVTAGGEATADIALEAEEPSDVQKPYAAHTVPGRINFADFDFGGEGVAYHDTTAGNQG
ncbi:MAG: PEGA domain-containing protein, partial [Methanoculleus bourgensis]|nr:PEGA domain-containing protein [Methanoculleus bourgensis]